MSWHYTYRLLGHGGVEIYRLAHGVRIVAFRGLATEAAQYLAYRALLARDLAALLEECGRDDARYAALVSR